MIAAYIAYTGVLVKLGMNAPPPEHHWPKAWRPRASGSSTILGLLLTGAGIVISLVAHVTLWIAGVAVVIACAVAFFRDAVMSAVNALGVAWGRIRHYDRLYAYAKDRETDVLTERIHIESLVEKLVALGQEPGLAIIEARRGVEEESFLIVIERNAERPLQVGQTVLIEDPPTKALLATFLVTDEVTEGYLAAPVGIREDGGLWWTSVVTAAKTYGVLQTKAVAVPV